MLRSPQIFSLLGFDIVTSENLTMANYLSYFVLMTFAWVLIDAMGRRVLLLWGSVVLTLCFLLLALFGGLAMNADQLHVDQTLIAIPGVVSLFVATGAFGIGWLATVWLVPVSARLRFHIVLCFRKVLWMNTDLDAPD